MNKERRWHGLILKGVIERASLGLFTGIRELAGLLGKWNTHLLGAVRLHDEWRWYKLWGYSAGPLP